MDWFQLYENLRRQKKAVLLDLLESVFFDMEPDQQREVFGEFTKRPTTAKADGQTLLEEVLDFEQDSLAKAYYQSFNINSKNFSHIPARTSEWFDLLGDLLTEASKLTRQGDHAMAVACFDRLYALIERMEDGDTIVFAEELGSWMIPVEEKVWVADYLASLAANTTPNEFAAKAAPLVDRDSGHSFSAHTYQAALKAASKEQATILKAELKRQQIRTGPEKRL